ncbi:MAG: VOC family protein [Gemmatimonadota bacterium]|nr:VOC family protein [Gemmatimonadota bacterium]
MATGAAFSEGGNPKAQRCGWLKHTYCVSWQVVPIILEDY